MKDILILVLVLVVVIQQLRIINLKHYEDLWIKQYDKLLKDYNDLRSNNDISNY